GHTRFSRDWSSDVCSSDLGVGHAELNQKYRAVRRLYLLCGDGGLGAGVGESEGIQGVAGKCVASGQAEYGQADGHPEQGGFHPGLLSDRASHLRFLRRCTLSWRWAAAG